jgi:hypothetical protein
MQQKICGIYCIEVVSGNLEKIGWKYIGQSKNCYKREKSHFYNLKKNNHSNRELQFYYNKYSKYSLRFYIIKETTELQLNLWEIWCIEAFNSKSNGFNRTNGGDSPPQNQTKNHKSGLLINLKTEEKVSFKSISEFCRVYKMYNSEVSNLLHGKRKVSKNWYNPIFFTPKFYEIISPINKKYIIKNINVCKFCKENNIKNRRNFSSMLKAEYVSCEGWRLFNGREKKKSTPKTLHVKKFKFIYLNGKIIEGENIKKFANSLGFLPEGFYGLISGKYKTSHGYKLYKDNIC